MRLARFVAVILASLAACGGCGGKHETASHEAEKAATALPPPTPDTTPVAALRTPAGIALKQGETSAAPTPATK